MLSIDLSQHFLLDGDLNSDTVSLCVMLKFAGGGMEHTLVQDWKTIVLILDCLVNGD